MKLKITGNNFPDTIRGQIVEGNILQIDLGIHSIWSVGFPGYEFEVIPEMKPIAPGEIRIMPMPETGLPAIFGQKVRRMEVEFQEEK